MIFVPTKSVEVGEDSQDVFGQLGRIVQLHKFAKILAIELLRGSDQLSLGFSEGLVLSH